MLGKRSLVTRTLAVLSMSRGIYKIEMHRYYKIEAILLTSIF